MDQRSNYPWDNDPRDSRNRRTTTTIEMNNGGAFLGSAGNMAYNIYGQMYGNYGYGNGRGYSAFSVAPSLPNASMGMPPPILPSFSSAAAGGLNASMMPPPSLNRDARGRIENSQLYRDRWAPPSRGAGSLASTSAASASTGQRADNRQLSSGSVASFQPASSQRNENSHPNRQAASTNLFVIDRKRESLNATNAQVKRVKTESIQEESSNAYDADTVTDSDTHVIFAIDFSGSMNEIDITSRGRKISRWSAVFKCVASFLDRQIHGGVESDDKCIVSVLVFNNESTVLMNRMQLVGDGSSMKATLKRIESDNRPRGGTSFSAGFRESSILAATESNDSVVLVFLTDGRPGDLRSHPPNDSSIDMQATFRYCGREYPAAGHWIEKMQKAHKCFDLQLICLYSEGRKWMEYLAKRYNGTLHNPDLSLDEEDTSTRAVVRPPAGNTAAARAAQPTTNTESGASSAPPNALNAMTTLAAVDNNASAVQASARPTFGNIVVGDTANSNRTTARPFPGNNVAPPSSNANSLAQQQNHVRSAQPNALSNTAGNGAAVQLNENPDVRSRVIGPTANSNASVGRPNVSINSNDALSANSCADNGTIIEVKVKSSTVILKEKYAAARAAGKVISLTGATTTNSSSIRSTFDSISASVTKMRNAKRRERSVIVQANSPWISFEATRMVLTKDSSGNKQFGIPAGETPNSRRVEISMHPFAQGGLRNVFRMKEFSSKNNTVAIAVAKESRHDLKYQERLSFHLETAKCQLRAFLYAKSFNNLVAEKVDGAIAATPVKVLCTVVYRLKAPTFPGGFRYLAVENELPGTYSKWNNNDGWVNNSDCLDCKIAQAFSHFSFEKSKHREMVVDIQGVATSYTDPQLHSVDKLYGRADRGETGFNKFFGTHKCNFLCKLLELPERSV